MQMINKEYLYQPLIKETNEVVVQWTVYIQMIWDFIVCLREWQRNLKNSSIR